MLMPPAVSLRELTTRSRIEIVEKLLIPIFYSALAGSATLLGLGLVLFAKKIVQKYSFAVVSLAAGVLLGTAFLHLIPEASELAGDTVFIWVLIGFAIFYVIESIVGFHACREENENNHGHVLGPVAAIGIFFHSILDGVAIGIGFEISNTLGLVTSLAVLLHELPEGIFTFGILLHAKMTIKRAMWWTIIVAMATPFGTLLTYLLFPNLSTSTLGVLLGIAAGSFVYIGASDLVPESHKSRSVTAGAFVVLGIMIMLFMTSVMPE